MTDRGQPLSGSADGATSAPGTHGDGQALTDEQVAQFATLIADGKYDMRDDLPAHDLQRLTDEVRQRLRNRLMRLIARAIAHDIVREHEQDTEVLNA